MSEWEKEQQAFLKKIGQVAPSTKPASTKKDEE
jgi:hypothetical protein